MAQKRKQLKAKVVMKDSNKIVSSRVVTRAPRIAPKTKQTIALLDSNPDMNQTEAWIRTHKTTNRASAAASASKVLNKPSVLIYRKSIESEAKRTALEVMQYSRKKMSQPQYAKLAADQAERILDRNLGKATVRQETQSTSVNVNVEAKAELNDAFTAFLKQQTEQT
jgi:hypothetical protein